MMSNPRDWPGYYWLCVAIVLIVVGLVVAVTGGLLNSWLVANVGLSCIFLASPCIAAGFLRAD